MPPLFCVGHCRPLWATVGHMQKFAGFSRLRPPWVPPLRTFRTCRPPGTPTPSDFSDFGAGPLRHFCHSCKVPPLRTFRTRRHAFPMLYIALAPPGGQGAGMCHFCYFCRWSAWPHLCHSHKCRNRPYAQGAQLAHVPTTLWGGSTIPPINWVRLGPPWAFVAPYVSPFVRPYVPPHARDPRPQSHHNMVGLMVSPRHLLIAC